MLIADQVDHLEEVAAYKKRAGRGIGLNKREYQNNKYYQRF